jgi:hypothetical protein
MTDLTDRYVGATLRSIPERQRADIEAELRASIGDAIDARTSAGDDVGEAEKTVLSGLGDPDRLAAGYAGRAAYLIGPDLFFEYRRLLKILLLSVVPIVIAVVAVIQIIAGEGIGSFFGESIGAGITVTVHLAFWTTLVFALIDRSSDKSAVPQWSLSSLPTSSTIGTIKLGDVIGSVVFIALAIAALVLQRSVSPVSTPDGAPIPVLDPSLWSFWLPFLIAVLVAEIVFELLKYRRGRWTPGLASINFALNVLFAAPVIYLLTTGQLLNPAFFDELGIPNAAEPGSAGVIISAGVVGIVALWDIVDGFRKARS